MSYETIKDYSDVKAGEAASLKAIIEVPENIGKIVSAQWDLDGEVS